MTEFEAREQVLFPDVVERWKITHNDLPDIPELHIQPESYAGYVHQGMYRSVEMGVDATTGSDGFTRCSGLIVADYGSQQVHVAHLEPVYSGLISRTVPQSTSHLWDMLQTPSDKDIVLIYGDISAGQVELEDACRQGSLGRVALSHINVASGGSYAWGFVYDNTRRQVKTFSREYGGNIATFSL